MQKIQQEWDALVDTADKTQGEEGVEKYGIKNEKLYEMLDDILKRSLSDADLCQLAATCGTLPVRAQDRDNFDDAVLEYMVKVFAETGDRDSLVKLLSTRVPDPLYYANIEWYLVYKGKKMKAPILILGEAYEKSQVPYARRLIADALRRGFTSLGVQGKEDDEFVKNAMQWYKENKEHLVPDSTAYYHPFAAPAPPFDIRAQAFGGHPPEPQYEKHPPLFVEKSSVEKSKETK